MSILFRTKRHLTIDQLTRAWGPELARADRGGGAHKQDLVGVLLEDIVNGRLDDVGPLRDGRRLGLRLITPEGRAGFLEGAQLGDLAQTDAGSAVIFHRVLIMKEAVLDFAHQHELPPPSWWADPVHASTEAASNTAVVDTAPRLGAPNEKQAGPDWVRRRGPSPRKLENTKNAMREEIRQSRLTIAQLQDMVEKDLASKYGVSRDTARKARKSVLSESVGICWNLSNEK